MKLIKFDNPEDHEEYKRKAYNILVDRVEHIGYDVDGCKLVKVKYCSLSVCCTKIDKDSPNN